MKREKKENTVYFLGAGASADAGVPVTGRLLSKIMQRSPSKGRSLNRFISILGFLPKQDGDNRPPIIDVISMLDTCIRENRPLDSTYTVERLRKLRNELTVELAEVIQHSSRKEDPKVYLPSDAVDQPGAKQRTIPAYYRRFALQLTYRNRRPSAQPAGGSQRLPPADTIITSNYDTNIDLALYEIVYAEETGYTSGSGKISDIYLGTEFRDPYTDADAFSDPERTIDLFKLHGSLNWLYCPRCNRIYVAAFGYSVRFLHDTRSKKSRDELTCFCGYYSLEPVIIAPSTHQEILNPHLQAIWMNAYQALESAEHWRFVGYSLPPQDIAVRSLLYKALDSKRHITGHEPTISVICPDSSISVLKPRYKALFGKVNFIPTSFRSYIQQSLYDS